MGASGNFKFVKIPKQPHLRFDDAFASANVKERASVVNMCSAFHQFEKAPDVKG